MTIEKAAEKLDERLREEPWFTAVGVGTYHNQPALYLYVKKFKGVDLDFVEDGWEGYHVEVRKMGTPRILAR